jgi:hypothetical protein
MTKKELETQIEELTMEVEDLNGELAKAEEGLANGEYDED